MSVFGPDKVAADIAGDFAIRGIVAEVLVGEWEADKHTGPAYVAIGLGRGSYDDPAGMRHAGRMVDVGGGRVARVLLARQQTFRIWVHAAAAPETAPELVAVEARRATAELLDATAAAIRRTRGGLASTPWTVEWLGEERGDFVYGSVARFDVTIALLVTDDARPVIGATQAEVTAQAVMPDGAVLPDPPETSTESDT